jgi:hypothetical protein
MGKKPLVFRPIKDDKHFEQRIGAIDLETEGLGGKALCISLALLNTQGELIHSYVDASPDFISRAMSYVLQAGPGIVWYSHNGQYDWRYLIDYIVENRATLRPEFGLRTENLAYQIVLRPFEDEKQEITLRDSYAMFPGKLADLTAKFAPDHAKLSGVIDFATETFNTHDPKHMEYALRDSESLALAMYQLNATIETLYGVPMGHTTAGTAVKAWRRTLEDPIFTHRPSMDFCRKAYYGGLVFLTDTNTHANCTTIDINSSYPNVMQKYGVPYGTPIQTKKFYHKQYPAIYHCTITAPDNLIIPIIPSRNAQGATRWLSGTLETYATNAELHFALAHGYTDLIIHDGVVWENFCFPFEDFVEKAKAIRAQFKGTPSETLAKLIQNSLYGKMGTRQERKEVFIPVTSADIGPDDVPMDDAQIYWIRNTFDEDILCNPAWAAFITAHGRLELLRNAYDIIGVEHCLYGDTDSLTAKESADLSGVDIGNEYGQFKIEKHWTEYRAIAPKVYAGCLDSGEWVGACKGIPLKIAKTHFKDLYATKLIHAEYETLQSFFVGLKKGFTSATKAARISTDIANSGSWDLLENGQVRPKGIRP